MNLLGNNQAKLNDVIFKERNKSYGAYAIRSSYNETLRKALFSVAGFTCLLFGAVYISNRANAITDEKPVIVDDIKPEVYEWHDVDMTPPTEQPKQNTSAAAAAPNGAIGMRVTDDAVETSSVNIDNPVDGQGPPDATGTSATSTLVSTDSNTATSTPSTVSTTSEPMVLVDEMPEFEGGDIGLIKYISKNIVYPEIAKSIGKEGTVHVSFVVNETGFVEGVKILRGIGYGCDEEVVRVVSNLPKWKKGGKNQGHPVKVRYTIPVSFRLK